MKAFVRTIHHTSRIRVVTIFVFIVVSCTTIRYSTSERYKNPTGVLAASDNNLQRIVVPIQKKWRWRQLWWWGNNNNNNNKDDAIASYQKKQHGAAGPFSITSSLWPNRRKKGRSTRNNYFLDFTDETTTTAPPPPTTTADDNDDDDGVEELPQQVMVPEDRQEENMNQTSLLPFQSILSYIIASVKKNHERFMYDPEKILRCTFTAVQIGLVMYLGHAVWTTVCEVIDEYKQDQVSSFSSSSSSADDPRYAKPSDVAKLMVFFENTKSMQTTTTTTGKSGNNSDPIQLPPEPLLQLALKLLASGMPLRSVRRSLIFDDDDFDQEKETIDASVPSVESLLLDLTRSEAAILHQCLWSPSSAARDDDPYHLWNSISGLQSVKERLLGTVTMIQSNNSKKPHNKEDHHHHQHFKAFGSLFHGNEPGGGLKYPSTGSHGILLYGPPGCGKTLLVKALASTVRMPCLVVTPSVLLRKYVGETNLQVRSLFTLASKIAPCIVCIDELDGLFRERSDTEHEVSRDLKTEFLQFWDGMMTTRTATSSSTLAAPAEHTLGISHGPHRIRTPRPILVVGATNRPFDVDSAVLRRLPQSHFVGLPDTDARFDLLTQLLQSIPTEPNVDLRHIATQTTGYSPSDLRQLLQTAALTGPLRRATRRHKPQNDDSSTDHTSFLTTDDILSALKVVLPTPLTPQYRMQLANFLRHPTSTSSSTPPGIIGNDDSEVFYNRRENNERRSIQKWETDFGNFYNIGTLEVDHETFDFLTDIAAEIKENQQQQEEQDNNNDSNDDF